MYTIDRFPRTRRQLQSNILLHDYPQYFLFNPPSLRFIVNFNVSAVTLDFPVYSDLQFNCGFMDGEDDRTVVNGVDVSLLLQSGKVLVILFTQTHYS